MPKLDRELVLASGSPRRRELLNTLGVVFVTDVSSADEHFSGQPEDMVRTLSRRKAEAAAARHPSSLILGADTIVAAEGKILGKPENRADAERMLRLLSGRWHDVYTGVTLLDPAHGGIRQAAVRTRVHFLPIPEEELSSYLDTQEPYDKAGAYAIQGMAGAFIDRIEGSYSNVVGLPLHAVSQMLRACSGE